MSSPKKAVCLISQVPELKEFNDRWDEVIKSYKERAEFAARQIDSLKKKADAENETRWRELVTLLQAKGLLQDFVYDRDIIGMDLEGDIIYTKKFGKVEGGGGLGSMPPDVQRLIKMIIKDD